jgi:hypothetical protein
MVARDWILRLMLRVEDVMCSVLRLCQIAMRCWIPRPDEKHDFAVISLIREVPLECSI